MDGGWIGSIPTNQGHRNVVMGAAIIGVGETGAYVARS